jgi:DNA-binding response OmpR family regulator
VQHDFLPACGEVLLVSSNEEDHASVRSILAHSGLKLSFTRSFQEARAILLDRSVGVVISSGQSGDGYGWKDLLRELQDNAAATRLVVADRLADEALWAEVLNFGGYDLLLKPFNPTELFRVVDMACRTRCWTELSAGQTK